MTGDMCTLDTPELIREQLDQVVIELGETALEVNPELEAILQANENEPVEQFLLRTDGVEILPPQVWPQVIDESPLPELAQLLVDPQQQEALNDLVLLELVELQNEQFIIEGLSEQLVFDLSGVLGEENGPPELPPQFEQLLQELGEEQFVEWLLTNQQETGTFSGVTEGAIGELDSEGLAELERVEGLLDQWLRNFDRETGGNEPCPDIVLPDPNVDDQPIELPPEMEQLRQELGDEAFAEFLQSNLEQIGNLTGVSQDELDQFDEEQLAEFDCRDELLQAWLEDFQENVEPELVLPGDADANGEVDFSDFLIMSRHFGTEVEGGFLEGDFDLNGVVEFPDFLVLSRHFGQTLEQQE